MATRIGAGAAVPAGDGATAAAVQARVEDHLDQQEEQSFPASDPPADWAGPPTWLAGGEQRQAHGSTPGAPPGHRPMPGAGGGSRRGLQVAGIPVRADLSLLVIVALIAWSFWLRYSNVASRGGALVMALVATALFVGSILAHELAHALEARHRGLHVRDITLYVFGGATAITDEARRPGDEFALTAVGPWTSIVLGCASGLVATGADHLGLSAVGRVAGELGWLNVLLGLFNLLPGAPLDGGRILDSVVWRVTRDRALAARVSTRSGQVIGAALAALGLVELLFLLGGFVAGLWLVLIGWFLMRSAAAERRAGAVRDRLRGRRVGDVVRPVAEVPAGISVASALTFLLRHGGIEVIGVTGPGGVVGALTIDDLRRVPAEDRTARRVDQVMTPLSSLPAIQASAPATQLLALLGNRPVVVLDGTRVRSLVTARELESTIEWLPPLPPGAAEDRGERPAPSAQDGRAGSGPGRRQWATGPAGGRAARRATSVLRIGLLVASGAVVLAAAAVVPLPLVSVSPGPALDVPSLLRTGGPTHPVDGKLLLTSVRLDAPSLTATVGALLDPHRDVLAQISVVPAGIDPADYENAQRQVFADSVQLASAVALRAAGYPVTIRGGGAVVRAVVTGGPATGTLFPGDVVVAATGSTVASAADLIGHLSTSSPGAPVTLRVRRGDNTLTLRVAPRWSNDLERPTLGILVEDASPLVALPFSVELDRHDIGGPSAGLMTALSVYAVTTGTDLTGGTTVAGTGTIDAEGGVGSVGGVAEKAAAASAAGATVFLVPSAEAAEARQSASGLPIRVLPVQTFAEALDVLRARASS